MDYSTTLFDLISILGNIDSHLKQLELELLKDYSTGARIQIDVPEDILTEAQGLCNIVERYAEIAHDINNMKRGG